MDAFVREPYRPDEIYACMAEQLQLRYIVESAGPDAEHGGNLPPGRASGLPTRLRNDLRDAVERLDSERIMAIRRLLIQKAEDFNYPALLNALKEAKEW